MPVLSQLFDDMFYISGEIPRATDYEKGLPTHVKDIGNGWEPDPWIMDERYAAIPIKDDKRKTEINRQL